MNFKRMNTSMRTPTGSNFDKPLYDQVVPSIDRVSRVVKGGRRFRFRALVVMGDKKGLIGVGNAKGADVALAIGKASNVAQRNMVKVVIEDPADSIPHEISAKVSGANILLKPAKEGTGLIAGGVVRQILELAGYRNIYSKSLGNNNKINVAYAVIKALRQLSPRDDWHLNKIKAEIKSVKK